MAEVSTNDYHDSEILPGLLSEIEGEVKQVSGDGAYDSKKCYEAIALLGAIPTILPQRNARKGKAHSEDRNKNIERIEEIGRKEWKEESGYHRRSISETTMFRIKRTFGGKVSSRDFDNQASELLTECSMLNRMIQVAKPDSYIVC